MKQDMNGVRTAQDLEQKYDLSSIVGIKTAVKNNEVGLNKTNTELEDFIVETAGDIDNLQSQIDGNITTYYYSGVPTLSNLPANEWPASEYNRHLGDLYFDKDTGYAYRFYLDSETSLYGWVKITDEDVTEALAIANAAKDTADGKRRVFIETPEPPYDSGDLRLNDGEIFVCQISKADGIYEDNDFITATKYTDDTLAIQVDNSLKVVSGTVTEIQTSQNEFVVSITNTVNTIDGSLRETEERLNTMSYSFGTNDLQIADSSDPTNARINNQGLKVYTYNDLQSIFNQKGTGVQKLIVVGDSQLANIRIVKAIDKNGNQCTEFHHLISNIQSLSDLE